MELALKTAPPSGSETKMNVLLLVKNISEIQSELISWSFWLEWIAFISRLVQRRQEIETDTARKRKQPMR